MFAARVCLSAICIETNQYLDSVVLMQYVQYNIGTTSLGISCINWMIADKGMVYSYVKNNEGFPIKSGICVCFLSPIINIWWKKVEIEYGIFVTGNLCAKYRIIWLLKKSLSVWYLIVVEVFWKISYLK